MATIPTKTLTRLRKKYNSLQERTISIPFEISGTLTIKLVNEGSNFYPEMVSISAKRGKKLERILVEMLENGIHESDVEEISEVAENTAELEKFNEELEEIAAKYDLEVDDIHYLIEPKLMT